MGAPPLSVRVVPAGADHREFVAQLSGRVFSRFGNYESLLPSLMGRSEMLTVVAESRRIPVGFAMLSLENIDSGELDLTAIAVDPAHQSRGVGRALLKHAEVVARKLAPEGARPSVRLTVAEDNSRGRRLFEGLGYRAYGGTDSYSGGQVAVSMRKRL